MRFERRYSCTNKSSFKNFGHDHLHVYNYSFNGDVLAVCFGDDVDVDYDDVTAIQLTSALTSRMTSEGDNGQRSPGNN